MREASVDAPPVIDWGVATLAHAGEKESGDLHLVKQVGRGVLVAAVDGLGHGAEAAAAARGPPHLRYRRHPRRILRGPPDRRDPATTRRRDPRPVWQGHG